MGGYQKKYSKQGYLLCKLKSLPFSSDKFPEIWWSSSSRYREGDTLTNRNSSNIYKCFLQKANFYSVFRTSLISAIKKQKNSQFKDFPRSPVVKTLHFYCRGAWVRCPGLETKILHGTAKKKEKTKNSLK